MLRGPEPAAAPDAAAIEVEAAVGQVDDGGEGDYVTLNKLMKEQALYLLLICGVIVCAGAVSLPVLLLPLAPAADGIAANGVYYGIYCGVFATLWAITNWDRLDYLFQHNSRAEGKYKAARTKDIGMIGLESATNANATEAQKKSEPPPAAEEGVATKKNEVWHIKATDWASYGHVAAPFSKRALLPGAKGKGRSFWARYVAAVAAAWAAFCGVFTLFGYLWDDQMERSFVLLYGAPVAFMLVDVAYFFIVPHEAGRSLGRSQRAFIVMLVFNVMLCLPILLLFGPTIVGGVLARHVHAGEIGNMVLAIMVPLTIPILVERIMTTTLERVMPPLLRWAGFDAGAEGVSDAAAVHINSVFEFSLLMLVFDGNPYVVAVTTIIVNIFYTILRLRDAYADGDPEELTLSWMGHAPTLAAPVIYLAHTTFIREYRNKPYYFIYRCDDAAIDWQEKANVMYFVLGCRVILLQVELAYCHLRGKSGHVHKVLVGGADLLWKHFAYTFLCLAFASTLFTSCFFIMHDGLDYLLSGFLEPDNCLVNTTRLVNAPL